ncbi:hypothetical protein WN59_08185 [Salinicoccus sediminis]|uniref:HTH araC/xylS-type domain-containing protein n=1 Tax=Salinicoccus sediminis TaxID=1432562 RepID=A0A0M2SMZ5_9STAP|nr:helix-turn-helix domain-containing protein [Salinicoccus sediminis]KKK34247.1 hypothetical protein WN59_08185 [Salinicoccus sediminis]
MTDDIHDDFMKSSRIIHHTTKMDVTLTDRKGKIMQQYSNHAIPSVLGRTADDYVYINGVLIDESPNKYLHYTNLYGIEYIAAGVYRSDGYIGAMIIGPFISGISILDFVQEVIAENNLPIGERKELEQFYQSLSVLDEMDTNHFGNLLVNLVTGGYIEAQPAGTSATHPVIDYEQVELTREEYKETIEKRYHHQNKMMEAIQRGDKEGVEKELDTMMDIFVGFSDRIPGSPIRSSKNMALVSNTSFRVAAENSGVHPIYLHIISERFAILIEKTDTLTNLKKLITSMANEYCDLVHSFSTGGYSPHVRKAMDHIMMNLGETLTLSGISEKLHINPSYLSRKFREETGISMTGFITEKRMDEAKIYLRKRKHSITHIALLLGFNDLNYFSRVFKKHTGLSPRRYAAKA